ncbi:MAG TPA: hypothetical protein VFE51_29030 [Verrucomicrobiae bacterium]|nr:hypothetical protein [Verrucomicrobiae bacterium]
MPDLKEWICRLKKQASAAFWSMPAVVLFFAILPAFFVLSGTFHWIMAILMLVLSLGIALGGQSSIRKTCASLLEAGELAKAEDERRRQQFLELQETCRQMEVEKKKAAEERQEQQRRLGEEQTRAAAVLQQAEALKQEKERLLADYRQLRQELTDAIDRRRLSETRNQDLDLRLREVEATYAGSFSKLKESEQEIIRLKESVRTLQAENDSFRQNLARQLRELEVAGHERAATETRFFHLKREVDGLKSRAEGAEERVRYLEGDLPKQQEFVARRETEKLLEAEQARNRELELQKSALESEIQELERKAGGAEEVIKELHGLLQKNLAEPHAEMGHHFVWQVNHFHENEVTLNFLNRGVPMDLIGTTSQPGLTIESPAGRHLGRNESGTIRFSSRAKLPQEFLVHVRMTAFAQEASFRIRPFAETKIERL